MIKKHISKISPRKADTHKGDFGHVLIIAGSKGMTGAAYLASQAAIISGSGLVTCGIPESLNHIMEIKLTEVMTLPLPETEMATLSIKAKKEIITFSKKTNAVGIGPGLSKLEETQKLVRELMKSIKKPIILDADGIISIKSRPNLLKRDEPTILTPHPGEMAQLIGKDTEFIQENRERVAEKLAKKYRVIVVLKGYRTVVANYNGELYINETGNSGMSSAGVGDVLTGIISSFIGQGIEPYSAAVVGVYVHGMAGDFAAAEKGQFSMTATDVLQKLPQAIKGII